MSSQTKIVRNCLYCGAEIIGRFDKKFCDDNCRNNYHYRIKSKEYDGVVKMVNGALLNNRKILKSLCGECKEIVKKKSLDDRGFDYDLITNIYKAKSESEYRIVYDYAYKILNDDDVKILRFVK